MPPLAGLLGELQARFVVPPDTVCTFVGGSVAAGRAHATSDVDVYVVTRTPAPVSATKWVLASLTPPRFPAVVRDVGGRTWDVEYLTIGQVGELCAMVAEERARPGSVEPSDADVDLVYRVRCGVELEPSGSWLAGVQRALDEAGVDLFFAGHAADQAQNRVDDARGLLDAGDERSAVLAARLAFEHAVDACLAARGEMGPTAKWRARKVAAVGLPGMDVERYWAIQAMSQLARQGGRGWVGDVLAAAEDLLGTLEHDA